MSDYDPGRKIPFAGTDLDFEDWIKARSIAREYLGPEHGDARRIQLDVDRIRKALALRIYSGHIIEMGCFNEDEARAIRSRLTDDELSRVRFTWVTFVPPCPRNPTATRVVPDDAGEGA